MATKLELLLAQIASEKKNKIIPENIKSGITAFGVTGTLQEGVNTSDATATASDIILDKTAYVNDEKITGTLEVRGAIYASLDTISATPIGALLLSAKMPWDSVFREGADIGIRIDKDDGDEALLAEAIGLTPEKIKSGETILGVTGTYTGDNVESEVNDSGNN